MEYVLGLSVLGVLALYFYFNEHFLKEIENNV